MSDTLDAPTRLLSAGSLDQHPQPPEPLIVDSRSQTSTISPLPPPGPPDISRLSLHPTDSMKQHDTVNTLRPQRAATEKVKLRILSQFTYPLNVKYSYSGQQLNFLFCTDDNPTLMRYYQFKGRRISKVSKRPIPQGHMYDCNKYITPQYFILQSQQNQLSFYNHDWQFIKTLTCPGLVIGVIGELYAVVRSMTIPFTQRPRPKLPYVKIW